ncbi:hypothetical protein JAAARDRAFT_195627 [Jaapia argillacea MUCL 33604]|uniref:Uncharacterized protein n=1 Tax=Jaapia argillacea MUCL 33604 TaxID=933084 RepID=A0A067PZP0_9AGAM|nr:hypothetical protein JAAARDRAFT_195627 [Jaapia argillacea MUCL 33604]
MSLMTKVGITKQNGEPFAGRLPQRFWQNPELLIAEYGHRLRGWPTDVPPTSPTKGSGVWTVGMAAALARMLAEGSISLRVRSGRSSHSSKSSHIESAPVSHSVPSTSAICREPILSRRPNPPSASKKRRRDVPESGKSLNLKDVAPTSSLAGKPQVGADLEDYPKSEPPKKKKKKARRARDVEDWDPY